jgi:prolyl-tRNA editing enzyme YbaK/EbsC (Cys-tRNA(Pro) deacylase)
VTALDRFMMAAGALGIEPEVRRFPQGTKTADDAAAAIGCDLGQIVKSLVFSVDGRPILALTSGVNRADVGLLVALARGEEVRRATPEEARAATGFAVGGTPPFGHPAPVPVFIDRDLLQYPEVWAAAGTPDSVFALTPDDLVRLTNGQVVDLKEPS